MQSGWIRRRSSRIAVAVVGVVLVSAGATPLLAPSATAATGSNGPLAAHTYFADPDGTKRYFPPALWGALVFNADGTKMAGTVPSTNTLKVWGNDGSESELASFTSEIGTLAWSPDGSALAVMTRGSGTDPYDSEIYRVPVAGGPAVKLVGPTQDRVVEEAHNQDQLAWSPDGSKIAFIGSDRNVDGIFEAHDWSQIYTVPAAGGATARYNTHLGDCAFPTCTTVAYSNPTWSPDGTAIYALVTLEEQNFESDTWTNEQYVGVTSGAAIASKIRTISTYNETVDSYSHLGAGPLLWSVDKSNLLLQIRASQEGPATPTVISASTGAITSTFTGSVLYSDWQPCPSGTCAPWVLPAKVPTNLKGSIPGVTWPAGRSTWAVGTLSVIPTQNLTGPIKLLIDGKVVRSAVLAETNNNRFSFKIPRLAKGKHTLQLAYGGNMKALGSSTGIAKITIT